MYSKIWLVSREPQRTQGPYLNITFLISLFGIVAPSLLHDPDPNYSLSSY